MQITYKDKVTLQSNPNIPDENKVTAKDMNEIKSVINFNEEEQQALNMSVQEIAQNVVNNSQEISNIKEEQTTQNDNIQTNSNNISDLQSNKADKNEIPTDLSQLSNENTKFVNETGLENAISQEKTQRQNADNNLQNQIDAITASTDVIDIVGTYQDLQDYDTSKVKQNDVIKVLKDSTHNNAMSYYRWQNQWIYVGSEGPYYTIGQTDELLQGKANQSDLNQTNTNVTNLAGRVSNNESKIENLEQEQTEQNTNISTNATNIETLQEENENLKKIVSQLPQVEGQGTSITLENTIEAQFTKFDEEGNSTQETTDGRQLLKYPYVATTITVNGVTFTDNGDGSLKINGTASEEARFNLQWDNKVPAGSYSYIVFNLPNNCFANYYTIGNKYGEDVGNRTSDTEINLGSLIVVPAGVTVSNVTVYPMLVSGTYTRETIPNWEKYTNGASPNPSYEQPIESAGDNGTINEKITNADGTEEQNYSIFVQQPMRSIGDVRDLFFKNTVDSPYYDENLTLNGWYERHYFNLTDLGDCNWSPVNQNENSRTQGLFMSWTLQNIENYSSSGTTIPKLLSNKYISKPNYNYQAYGRNPQNYTISTYGGNILYIQNSDFSGYTNEKVKEAMAGTILQYPRETPLDLPCTEEQVEQIENKPSTYKEMTIIQSEDETPAYLEVSGIRDINTMFDKVTNAIVSLGGNV